MLMSCVWYDRGSKKRNCDLADSTTIMDAFVPEPCFRFDYESTWDVRLEIPAPAGCIEEVHISENNNNGNENATTKWTCGSNKCGTGKNNGYAIYPRRFFTNISAHIDWYLQRGVDITAVLSVRDKSASRAGKMSTHCNDVTVSMREEEKARAIMSESLRRHGKSGTNDRERVVVVSYETLMALQEPYLFDAYQTLGINSTYVPDFKDGNTKYFKSKR